MTPRNCKLICNGVISTRPNSASGAGQLFYRVRAELQHIKSDLCTGVSKQPYWPQKLSDKWREDQPRSQGPASPPVSTVVAEHPWCRGQVTCSLLTSVSSALKQEGQSRCSFLLRTLWSPIYTCGSTESRKRPGGSISRRFRAPSCALSFQLLSVLC